ncbi:hypothetical protein SAMN05421505_120109 [Sinosporangium album]|uniref:Uncharacterized protein n=1 Tax=Sinosporangium album TaxID=504805 RepID=A0A1G8EI21_9ACTN|nr:hypothetical protein [Sinosporangium album]SDH69491.1 hypothetical protein SAMN05421505_120109 [Sinosporangium album]
MIRLHRHQWIDVDQVGRIVTQRCSRCGTTRLRIRSAPPSERTLPMDSPHNPRALELARDALTAAIAGDADKAETALQAIADETGPDGTYSAILAWCDTLIDRLGLDTTGKLVIPGWLNAATGRMTGPADTPVTVVWAGRLITARANSDLDQYTALLDALPDDDLVVGEHVWELLSTVALMLCDVAGGTPRQSRGAYINGDDGYPWLTCGTCQEPLLLVEAGVRLSAMNAGVDTHTCAPGSRRPLTARETT